MSVTINRAIELFKNPLKRKGQMNDNETTYYGSENLPKINPKSKNILFSEKVDRVIEFFTYKERKWQLNDNKSLVTRAESELREHP